MRRSIAAPSVAARPSTWVRLPMPWPRTVWLRKLPPASLPARAVRSSSARPRSRPWSSALPAARRSPWPRRRNALAVVGDPANHLGENLARLAVDDDGGDVVERRRLGVDDAELGAVLASKTRDAGSGGHLKRAAHDQNDVGCHGEHLRLAQRRLRQRLSKQHD